MKKLLPLVLMVLLSSCASLKYGDFTTMPPSKESQLAEDAANRLARVYVPAQTTFKLSQRANDRFGIKLLENLRKKGYGIAENVSPKKSANFFYVLDETERNHLYRVSLFVGKQSLSRAYVYESGALMPIGIWSHKE